MRKTFTLILLFGITVLFGQIDEQEVDSLLQVVEMSNLDTNEVKALYTLTHWLSQKEPEAAENYANRAIQLADSLGWSKGMALGYKNLGFVHRNNSRLNQSLEPFQKSLAIFEAIKDKSGMASLVNELGVTYFYLGDYSQAIEYFKQASDLEFELGNIYRSAGLQMNIGNVYKHRSNYPMALESFEKAFDLQSSIDDHKLMASTLLNIGSLHILLNENDKAIISFKEGLENAELANNTEYIGSACLSLSSIFMVKKQFKEALDYANKGLNSYKEVDFHTGVPVAIHSIGLIYYAKGDNKKALENYEEAYSLLENTNIKHELGKLYNSLAEVWTDMGDTKKALGYARKAKVLGEELGHIEVQKNALFFLQKNYAAIGNSKSAYENLNNYNLLNDSLLNESKIKEITQIEMQYAFNREQLADSLAFENEKIILKSEVKRERQARWFFLGIAGLLGLLAMVLYRNNQRRRQTNQLLSEQKSEIEKKSQQNELLLKEIHHRVKNNLQTISSLLFLQSAHIEDSDVRQAVSAGQHRVESMALIHQKLYQRDNLASIEMKDYLTNLGKSLIDTFSPNPDKIDLKIEMEELELDVDTAVPLGLIANEVITNSLKYAFPNGNAGEIKINMTQNEQEKLELLIKDNGVGNSNIKKENSFGLQLIDLLTSQLGGKMEKGQENGYWVRLQV